MKESLVVLNHLILLRQNAEKVGKTEAFMRVPNQWLAQAAHQSAEALHQGILACDPVAIHFVSNVYNWHDALIQLQTSPTARHPHDLAQKILSFSQYAIAYPDEPVNPDAAEPQTHKQFLESMYTYDLTRRV